MRTLAAIGLAVALAVAVIDSTSTTLYASPSGEPEVLAEVAYERGGFNWIAGFSVLAPDDIWAAATGGFVHYDGASWRLAEIIAPGLAISDFETVDGVGWAVGNGCSAIRFDRGAWSIEKLPWLCELDAVAVTPSGKAWAVGGGAGGSVVLHHDGSDWTRVEHPRGSRASAVFMLSDDSGWLATYDDDAERAQLLMLSNGSWERIHTPSTDSPIRSIHGVSGDNIWAMGGHSSQGVGSVGSHVRMRFDGEAWSVDRDPTHRHAGAVRDVQMLPSGTGWAVDDNSIVYRFDGRKWLADIRFEVSHRGEFLNAIGVVDENDIWFGGSNLGPIRRENGAYSSWDGNRGTITSYFGGASGLTSLSMSRAGYGWAVGMSGPAVSRVDGQWHAVDATGLGSLPAELMHAVLVVDEHDVWVSTPMSPRYPGPELYRFDGTTWTDYALPTENRIEAFSAVAPDDIWAVTSNWPEDEPREGDVMRFDGAEWHLEHSVVGDWLIDLDVVASGVGWAVGGNTALRLDGGAWAPVEPGVVQESDYLRSVRVTASDQVWLASARTLIEYDGRRSRRYDLTLRYPQDHLTAVDVAPNGDAWALADLSIWVSSGSNEWRGFELAHGMSMPVEQHDIEIVNAADGYTVFVSGRHDTIARIDVPNEGLPLPEGKASAVHIPIAVR